MPTVAFRTPAMVSSSMSVEYPDDYDDGEYCHPRPQNPNGRQDPNPRPCDHTGDFEKRKNQSGCGGEKGGDDIKYNHGSAPSIKERFH